MIPRILKFLARSIFCAACALALTGGGQAQTKDCDGNNLVPGTEFCLTGTAVIGGGGMAVFKAKGQTQSVGSGENIGGWRIIAITSHGVTIQSGALTRQLEMNALSMTSPPPSKKHQEARQLHNVSPIAAGKAASVGTTGPGDKLSISTHLPPVEDY